MGRAPAPVLAALLVLSTVGAPRAEQEPPAPPANLCADDPRFREFDFWLGEWRVTNRADGRVAGRNRIVAIEAGCALQENWTSRRGTTGMSLNWFDPVRGLWRQVWIAAPGYVIDIEGGLRQGAMVLEGRITTYGDGASHPFRGTWTPNDDGTVRQFFEQYSEAEGAWQPWFDGLYTPIDADDTDTDEGE